MYGNICIYVYELSKDARQYIMYMEIQVQETHTSHGLGPGPERLPHPSNPPPQTGCNLERSNDAQVPLSIIRPGVVLILHLFVNILSAFCLHFALFDKHLFVTIPLILQIF